jgi:hypothetical protein
MGSTRSAVVTHTGFAALIIAHGVVVDVLRPRAVHIIEGAVVVEMAAAPVAALVTVADVAKAVIDTAIVADVLAPVAGVKPVGIIPVAPVAWGPESAFVRSLHPRAGHPGIAVSTPGPVSGRPDIAVAGNRRLIVVGQGRWRLGSGVFRLLSVTRIIRTLVRCLGRGAVRLGRRSALLSAGRLWRLRA